MELLLRVDLLVQQGQWNLHMFSAMFGQQSERINNSIRFSFGLDNTEAQIIQAACNTAISFNVYKNKRRKGVKKWKKQTKDTRVVVGMSGGVIRLLLPFIKRARI